MISERRPVFFSNWDLLAAGSLAALALVYFIVLPALPDPVPTHFNKAGTADGWTPKSALHWIIFSVPVIVWAIFFVIGALTSAIPADPAKARIASMQPTRGFLVLGFSIIMGACLLIPFFGLKILFGSIAVMFACIIMAIFFTIREAKEILADLPESANYRWGVFYVNPEDPRLWVEKSCGVGITLNYAKPAAWLISIGFILLTIVVIFAIN
jgi:uncharacterized membrane protein